MDRWGDHALTCSCADDRTVRHNALRNVVFGEAVNAGLRPEREKAGLLPGRPGGDGLPVPRGDRRPAGVWNPRGLQGRAEALDFAVTSGLRADRYRQASENPTAVLAEYEAFKRAHKDTCQLCQAQGLQFTPYGHRGARRSPLVRAVLDWVAAALAASQHEAHSSVSLRIAQRMSCTLQRENARALVRRQMEPGEARHDTGWASWAAMGYLT